MKALLLVAALAAAAPAARAAEIHGRITHATRPEAVAGLDVQAIGIDDSERTITRETKTDREGRYRFTDLPAPAAYLVRARYGEVVFPGGSAVFRPGEPAALAQTIDFAVADAVADASKLRIATIQWVIARSAGAWQVRQAVVVANPEPAVVIVPDGQPSPLRVALAPGHGEVSGGFGPLPPGVTLDGDVATIRGPILPGDDGFSFDLVYDVTAPDDELAAKIALPSPVDQLSVYVQDFGIDVNAGALHPARPARQDDVIYQSFLGFDLPAGSEREVVVRVLEPATPVSQGWVALVAALLAGGLLFFVAGPIAFSSSAPAPDTSDHASPESHALDAAFADLEHDFETGKLSPADRDALHADLERERQAPAGRDHRAASAQNPLKVCSCGRAFQPGDRFCAGCGSAL